MGDGTATVTHSSKKRGEDREDLREGETSEGVPGPAKTPKRSGGVPMARVTYGQGVTLNIGGMEFQRIDVRLEMPARPTPDGIDDVFDFCVEWVDDRLAEEVKAAKGSDEEAD